ncbi:hypothetical protein [Mucilaginibacter sp. CSA2-8R]|uniref:hypothetical protein n=1 Tax=Mucilaginibacter sp. CSA2-8R TaxID=3141542 RepID=UPI00315D743B
MENSANHLVQVYAADFNEAMEIQAMLQINDIESFIENENLGVIAPWLVSAGGVAPVKVMVAQRDLQAAVAVLSKNDEDSQGQGEFKQRCYHRHH